MASSGKKGKKNKGKTVPLTDFLSTSTSSWVDQVEEAEKLIEFNRKPALPEAPRAARAIEFDESRISKNPPFIACLSNLSYELEEEDVRNAFAELAISSVNLPRDERTGRLKGFGQVEFSDRSSLILALQKHETTIKGRRIRIEVGGEDGERRRWGMKDNRNRDSNYESEKTLGDWRSGSRSEFGGQDDRRGPSFGRREYSSYRDREMDRGRGGDRDSTWRNSERGDRDRDRDRDRDGRGSFGGRRGYNDYENNSSEPKTRTKLNLKPRTKPIEEIEVKEVEPVKEKPSAASIFGGAKPVDTAAREREIEERLAKERVTKGDGESHGSEDGGGKPAPKENAWGWKSKTESESDSRGNSNKNTDDLDEPPPTDEDDKEGYEQSMDSESRKNYDSENDGDSRYSRQSKTDSRYNDRDRDDDRSYRRDVKDRKDRRDDRRDWGYDGDRRGGNGGGRNRDQDSDGDYRRYSDRDGDQKRYSGDRDGESRRYQERDSGRHRDSDEHLSKGPRGDKRGGSLSGDKNRLKSSQERERGPQSKEKPKEKKRPEDGIRMPKFKEAEAPNYIGKNMYSFLDEDGVSE